MGWLWLLLLAVGVLALLRVLGVARPLWSFVGAALMLGAAGYALQGSPGLAGRRAVPDRSTGRVEPELIALRNAMFGRFTADYTYSVAADAMLGAGETHAAVQVMLGGLHRMPRSVALWTGLGTAFAAHDGGQLSPPALFAFRHAMRLSPRHPGPPFFLGLAHIRAGELEAARPYWARALALTPQGVSFRNDIAVRLALLDRYLALQQAGPSPAR